MGLGEEQLRQAGDKLGLAGAQVLGDIGKDISADALSRINALSDVGQRIEHLIKLVWIWVIKTFLIKEITPVIN